MLFIFINLVNKLYPLGKNTYDDKGKPNEPNTKQVSCEKYIKKRKIAGMNVS